MTPIITVIVPTIGRDMLVATLESLAQQRLAQYMEVLVVADTHNREVTPPELPIIQGVFANLQWLEHDAGFSAWGHPQRNFAMAKAEGMWVATLDDDDVWVPNALDLIIGAVSKGNGDFHIFRMRHCHSGVVIWDRKFPTLGNVGTPMMVWRNGTTVGEWGRAYEGDFNFVTSTIHKLPEGVDSIHWQDPIIADIRPVGPPAGVQTW